MKKLKDAEKQLNNVWEEYTLYLEMQLEKLK